MNTNWRYPNQAEMIEQADNYPKGWIMCKCGIMQGCHADSICHAQNKCVHCIADDYHNTPMPGPKKVFFNDWDSDIASVLVYYLTKGKQARGI